jgi:hypothetical protein
MVEPKRLKDKRLTLNQLAFAQNSIDRQIRLEQNKPTELSATVLAVKDIEELRNQAKQLAAALRKDEEKPACE